MISQRLEEQKVVYSDYLSYTLKHPRDQLSMTLTSNRLVMQFLQPTHNEVTSVRDEEDDLRYTLDMDNR